MYPQLSLTLIFKCWSYLIVRTPIAKKDKAEDYPKNFALLKMAEKFKKNNEEQKKVEQPALSLRQSINQR